MGDRGMEEGLEGPTAALPIEEEESLLTIEIEDGDFADSDVTFNLMGLETDSPLLRIGTKMYEGRFEYVIGTHLFFSPNASPVGTAGSGARGVAGYSYHGKASKKIVFRP